jgi:outer membrane protein TolC
MAAARFFLAAACLFGQHPLVLAQAPTGTSSAMQSSIESLTLPMAVEIALRTNPLTRATASGREIASAQVEEARAGRFPVVQLSESVMNGNNPVFVFGSLLEQARFKQQNFDLRSLNNPDPLNNFRFSLTVKMPLFDQRQTATHVNQAQFRRRQADAETEHVAQQIRFETLRAFYGVLLARAKQEVAGEAVKLAEADVKRSRDRVEAGTAVVSDLLSAEVQLADFRQQQIEAEEAIITAQAALNTALGLPINTPQKVAGQLVEKAFDLAGQDELIRLALDHRPDYQRAGLSLRSSAEQVRGAHSEYLPRVDVFANAGVSRNNWAGGSGDYIVGASLTFNLFDAGRNARIAQARAAESLAASQQEHLANQIRLEVVRAYQQFVSARERVKVSERVIAHATEALRIVQDRYNEGLTTIAEVLRAETALVRAQSSLVAARYDYYVGYAALLLSSGQLTDVQPFVS